MKKYIRCLFLIIIINIIFITITYAAGFDNSTEGFGPVSTGGSCPLCSWTYNGGYDGGIRLALYKYTGSGKGNLEQCGESIDLFNKAGRTSYTAKASCSGSDTKNCRGIPRLEYIYKDVQLDFETVTIEGRNVSEFNDNKQLNMDGEWQSTFIKNFTKSMGSNFEEINKNIKELFGYDGLTEENLGDYYISVEPTMIFANRQTNIRIHVTGYEAIMLKDTLNKSDYTITTTHTLPYDSVTTTCTTNDDCDSSYECKQKDRCDKTNDCDKKYCIKKGASLYCKNKPGGGKYCEGETYSGAGWNFSSSQGGIITDYLFNSMFIKKDDLKIFNSSQKSYDGNNFVNYETGNGGLLRASTDNGRVSGISSIENGFKKDDFPYGITILWLRDVVDDPEGGRTCKNYCAGYEGTALSNCAEQFCEANKPGDTTCVESCYDVAVDSPGCDRKKNNVCYNENLETNNIKASNVCKASSKTEDETLKSGICYDDVNTSDYVLESKNVVVNKNTGYLYIGDLTKPVNISYFKVECDEKVTFKNLPRQSVAHVSTTNTASLYIGYTLQYNRSCQIYYKKADETWTTNFDESRAKIEYTKYEEALPAINKKISDSQKEYNELKNKSNKTKEEEAKMNSLKSYIETTEANRDLLKDIIKELKNVETDALNKLNRVKDSDYDPTTSMINDVTIKIASQDGKLTTTHTLTLVPVYCLDTNVSSSGEKYCTLEDNVNYKWYKETNNVKCTNSAGNEIKATVNGGSSTYEKTVYYTLPPSYVGVDKNGAVVICHDEKCISDKKLPTSEMIEGAWVFDALSQNVSLETYNGLLEEKSLVLNISGVGSCGQFSYDLDCSYQFESSKKCIDECIGEYNKPNTEMTEAEFNACFKKYCSCDSYCGSNVACRMKYCPQECEGCNDLSSDFVIICGDKCIEDCDNTYRDKEENITCRYNNCCRNKCNGEEGCIYNCCSSECDEKYNNHLISLEEYKKCKRDCLCENGNCETDYIYRTINLNRPFPDGDNSSGRIPGANWNNKESYITESSDIRTKYYDASDGKSDQYEYRIVLTSENIKQIKNDNSINKTYTEYKESKKARNTIEEATNKRNGNAQANVYCSYIIHDYFETLGIKATSNVRDVKDQNILGSGCYVR